MLATEKMTQVPATASPRLPAHAAIAVADASLAWQYDKRTTLRLFGRNLADKVYATRAYNNQFMLGEARRFELVAEMKF